MVEPHGEEEAGEQIEHRGPCRRHIAEALLKFAGQYHQPSLAYHARHTVEGGAHSHEGRLLMAVELKHIVAVGRYVVGGR